MAGTQIDLAAARLLARDVDGARDSIDTVLQLTPADRNAALVGRMSAVGQMLSSSGSSKLGAGHSLLEEVKAWLDDTASEPLPTGLGRGGSRVRDPG